MKICVVAPSDNVYSETFIHAHMHSLSADTINLVGDGSYFPIRELQGETLYPRNLSSSLSRRLFNRSVKQAEVEALSKFLIRKQVDVVLAEYGPTACAILDSCQMANVPLVAHFHGFDAFQYSTAEKYKDRYQKLFHQAASLIAASQSMANQLCFLGAKSERIFVNHYGVNVSKFQGGEPGASPPHFVAVGRFVEKKAPHLTLLAFHQVIHQIPDAHLSMIGDGPLLEACRQIVIALKLEKHVSLRGACSPDDVAQALRNARALVQHSLRTGNGDSESLGVVFLEAGAMGIPSIATRHDGIPEVVLDGETGLLAEEGDIEQYAKHMVALATDPALAQRLGDAAYQRIITHFTEENSLTGLHEILKNIVQKG
jgi:glycosyltransferase involved in cell wall biosynthesis